MFYFSVLKEYSFIIQKLFLIFFLEQLVEVFVLISLLFKHFYLQYTIEANELIFFFETSLLFILQKR